MLYLNSMLTRGGVIAIVLLPFMLRAAPVGYDSSSAWIRPFLDRAGHEIRLLEREYAEATAPLLGRLHEVKTIFSDPRNRTPECGFSLLWERLQLEETLGDMAQEHELKLLKLRYRKGVEITKMLYEKVLSMDHHFSSLKAQQGLINMSNPHNYAEFKEYRSLLDEKVKKKFGFEFPQILQSNPYLSVAYTLVGSIFGAGEDKDKKSLGRDKLSCILDFTVRMHNDLNVIYYETGYLRDANLTLKKECETLFSECTRQVGYTIPLSSCRDSDDWERLYGLLDGYVAKALGENQNGGSTPANGGSYFPPNNTPAAPDPRWVQRATVNLQFSLDRVTQFIEKYSNFVSQGNEYYKKFAKIASSYENEKKCVDSLPEQFTQLKNDIELTLEKFNSAYRMPEVQGSKLKDLMYGTGLD